MTSSRCTSQPDPGTSGSWLELSFGIESEGTSGSRVGIGTSVIAQRAKSSVEKKAKSDQRGRNLWSGFKRFGQAPTHVDRTLKGGSEHTVAH